MLKAKSGTGPQSATECSTQDANPISRTGWLTIFWGNVMETISPEERDFFEWILTERNRCYWEFDRNGQRIKMIRGWEKAETEYNRILGIIGLGGNSEK